MGHHPLFQASALVTAPGRARIDTQRSTGPGRVPAAIQAAPLLAQRQAERELPTPTEPFAGLTDKPGKPAELLHPTLADYLWLIAWFCFGGLTLFFAARLVALIADRLLS